MGKVSRSLLIGATGFIGRNLANYLEAHGQRVVGTYFNRLRRQGFDKKVILVRCDVTKQGSIQRILRQFSPDYIYYLAAQSSVYQSWLHPVETLQVNFLGGVYLFEALKRLRSNARVLVFSSGTTYGTSHSTGRPLSEAACLRPKDPYSVSKMGIDFLSRSYAQAYGLNVCVLRLANLTGPGQSTVFSIANFASQIARMEMGYDSRILRVGNLSAKRDYLDIRDGIRAIHLVAKYGKKGEAYNIASGKTISLEFILKELIQISQLKKDRLKIKRNNTLIPKDEIPEIRLNPSKIKRLSGWKAQIPIEKTLHDILNEWRKQVRSKSK